MRILIALFSLLIIFCIGACSIKHPKLISVEKVELLDETDTEIIIRSMITVFNPNQINFSANNVELSIFIDTSYIGVASMKMT